MDWRLRTILCGAAAAACAFGLQQASEAQSKSVEISALSTKPELVTGGDVLVRVKLPANVAADKVAIAVAGRSVTAAFRKASDGHALVGLVTGLQNGRNRLEVTLAGRPQGTLTLTNHPIAGPVISGPHQMPFVCETQAFGFGPPVDADCSVTTRIDYFYRGNAPPPAAPRPDGRGNESGVAYSPWKTYDPSAPRPADLATTTTSEGKTVPYIVRREMGTINRAVYVIVFLHEPGRPLPVPGGSRGSWNGKLVYSYGGGGCGAGYRQGASVGGLTTSRDFLEDGQLGDYATAKGYALAGGLLNVSGTSCSDVISAETTMMVKEHVIDQFGVPIYTVGSGRSGGSMQQHSIANNYPGLLDGIVPTASVADALTFLQPLFDCELIEHAYKTSTLTWTNEQRRAVNGQSVPDYCTATSAAYSNLKAGTDVPTNVMSPALVYSAANPTGARFTYQDNLVNVYGRDPKTGFARRPFDNLGVQYGLQAFNSGAISFEQFLDLNQRIGGQDVDGNIVPERMVANVDALKVAYQSGRINDASRGLSTIPIIDSRPYTDGTANVHDSFASHVTRARLIAANGHANNQLLHTYANGMNVPQFQAENLDLMDRWLMAIIRDTEPARTPLEKVVRNKPADAIDACYTPTETITDVARCKALYPVYANPRSVAGMPTPSDILKCELKAVDRKDYRQPLTDAQLGYLKAVFARGVCDYSKKGIAQRPPDTWLSYPQGAAANFFRGSSN